MAADVNILVAGANGFVGTALCGTLAENKIPFVRASHSATADVVLDMENPIDGFLSRLPGGLTHAVICSAISNIDRCFKHPEETAFFNVHQTRCLIDGFVAREIMPVFCSSDAVFRGDRGSYAEHDERLPTTIYGQQKRAVEDHLLAGTAPYLIVRLSKLYSTDASDTSPILQTITRLRSGQRVLAATDAVICPTNVVDVARGILRLIADKAAGPFHVSPPADGWYTRYTLAMTLAARLGAQSLVDPCLLGDLPVKDLRPKDTSLLNQRLRTLTGWQPRAFSADLDTVLPR
ncbi:MAG: SDR family oxidoreductase [Rhodospirillaceae bacterium]